MKIHPSLFSNEVLAKCLGSARLSHESLLIQVPFNARRPAKSLARLEAELSRLLENDFEILVDSDNEVVVVNKSLSSAINIRVRSQNFGRAGFEERIGITREGAHYLISDYDLACEKEYCEILAAMSRLKPTVAGRHVLGFQAPRSSEEVFFRPPLPLGSPKLCNYKLWSAIEMEAFLKERVAPAVSRHLEWLGFKIAKRKVAAIRYPDGLLNHEAEFFWGFMDGSSFSIRMENTTQFYPVLTIIDRPGQKLKIEDVSFFKKHSRKLIARFIGHARGLY